VHVLVLGQPSPVLAMVLGGQLIVFGQPTPRVCGVQVEVLGQPGILVCGVQVDVFGQPSPVAAAPSICCGGQEMVLGHPTPAVCGVQVEVFGQPGMFVCGVQVLVSGQPSCVASVLGGHEMVSGQPKPEVLGHEQLVKGCVIRVGKTLVLAPQPSGGQMVAGLQVGVTEGQGKCERIVVVGAREPAWFFR